MSEFNKNAAVGYLRNKQKEEVVISSGYGASVIKMIETAEQSGIPVYCDDSTASIINMLNIGQEIPGNIYDIISELCSDIIEEAYKNI